MNTQLSDFERSVLSERTVRLLLIHLKHRGYKLSRIAAEANVSKTTVYNIADGKTTTTRTLEEIYTAVKKLYPEEWREFMREYVEEVTFTAKIFAEKNFSRGEKETDSVNNPEKKLAEKNTQ